MLFETPKNWAVKVTETPSKWGPLICHFWKYNKSPISTKTTENNLYYTYIQTREYSKINKRSYEQSPTCSHNWKKGFISLKSRAYKEYIMYIVVTYIMFGTISWKITFKTSKAVNIETISYKQISQSRFFNSLGCAQNSLFLFLVCNLKSSKYRSTWFICHVFLYVKHSHQCIDICSVSHIWKLIIECTVGFSLKQSYSTCEGDILEQRQDSLLSVFVSITSSYNKTWAHVTFHISTVHFVICNNANSLRERKEYKLKQHNLI